MTNFDELFSCVKISSEKGYGIKLLKDLRASDSNLEEKPIFSYLHFYSKKSSLSCDRCFLNVGSFCDNLNHVLKIDNKTLDPKLREETSKLSQLFPELNGRKVTKCDSNCNFVFCSQECLEDSSPTHLLLCKLMDSTEKSKWNLFMRHSLKTHENFYFAGLIYVHVLYDSMYNKKPAKKWMDKLSEFWALPWDELSTYGTESRNPLDMALTSFNLLEDSLQRFRDIALKSDSDVQELFSHHFYLRLLGMMDLVCVDIEIQNPLNDLLFNLTQHPEGKKLVESLSKDLMDVYKITKGVDQEEKTLDEIVESRELFPDNIGLGLFNLLSKMNHSCQPNFEVEYRDNNTAKVNPLSDVLQGEEATISYIDENQPFENRQKKLLKVSLDKLSPD